jgi:hypothetical protein
MKKKVTMSCIFAAVILVVMSFATVVGYQSVQANEKEYSSPLFTVRTQRAIQKGDANGISTFLGKGKQLNIFPGETQRGELITAALKIFSTHPALLNRLLDNLDKFPALTQLLIKYNIHPVEIKNYMKMIQDNPLLLTDKINEIQTVLPHDGHPQSQGLNTSNPLGCFIVALVALIPITVVLTLLLLLFTVRILTCLNINDCANNIAEQIWSQLLQGLTPG